MRLSDFQNLPLRAIGWCVKLVVHHLHLLLVLPLLLLQWWTPAPQEALCLCSPLQLLARLLQPLLHMVVSVSQRNMRGFLLNSLLGFYCVTGCGRVVDTLLLARPPAPRARDAFGQTAPSWCRSAVGPTRPAPTPTWPRSAVRRPFGIKSIFSFIGTTKKQRRFFSGTAHLKDTQILLPQVVLLGTATQCVKCHFQSLIDWLFFCATGTIPTSGSSGGSI